MFINDCTQKSTMKHNVANYLIDLVKNKIQSDKANGIKPTVKLWNNTKFKFVDEKEEQRGKSLKTTVFKTPLKKMQTEDVTLTATGQTLPVSKFVHELCEFILANVETTGIFRKSGSLSTQQRVKSKIDNGGELDDADEISVIDAAAILKLFLRDLPEPLIPDSAHNMFLTCWSLENKEEAILFACLLLPTENLNLFTYLMHFFKKVDSSSSLNKMDSYNIAVCITPNMYPIHKLSDDVLFSSIEITKFFIENANNIGLITNKMQQKLSECEKKMGQKKRNSALPMLRYFKHFCQC